LRARNMASMMTDTSGRLESNLVKLFRSRNLLHPANEIAAIEFANSAPFVALCCGVKNGRPLGCVQYRAASPFRALRLMAFPTVHMQRD
jgi:hypothetical protein